MHIHARALASQCIYECMFVCIYARTHMHMTAYIIHTYKHNYERMCVRTHIHAFINAHTSTLDIKIHIHHTCGGRDRYLDRWTEGTVDTQLDH